MNSIKIIIKWQIFSSLIFFLIFIYLYIKKIQTLGDCCIVKPAVKQFSVLGLYAISAFLPKEVARLDVVIEKMQMSEGEQHGYFWLRQKKNKDFTKKTLTADGEAEPQINRRSRPDWEAEDCGTMRWRQRRKSERRVSRWTPTTAGSHSGTSFSTNSLLLTSSYNRILSLSSGGTELLNRHNTQCRAPVCFGFACGAKLRHLVVKLI